jgi:hypothetical protein
MKPLDPSQRAAEVLRLGLVEGVGVRAIARRLGMARKTVRKILGRSLPKPVAVVTRWCAAWSAACASTGAAPRSTSSTT